MSIVPQFVVANPFQSDVKCLISTQEEAKEMGRQDAADGLRCDASRYHFADANSIDGCRLSGDYTFAYVCAKGL